MDETVTELVKFGSKIAKKAGKILLRHYEKEHKIEFKGENDLVTEADKKVENFLIKKIKKRYPHHEILAEESGIQPVTEISEERIRWVIDPLDGTTNFAHGFPIFSISIGIQKNDELIGGIVYIPTLKELFSTGKYMGSFLNGKPITVSKTNELSKSLVATGFPGQSREINLLPFQKILFKTQAIRRAGSAAIDLCYVACGRLDGFWEFGLKPWDTAAGALMVEEAGGHVQNLDGSKFNIDAGNIIATNGKIYQEMIKGMS